MHSFGGFLSITAANLVISDSSFSDSISLKGGALYFTGRKAGNVNILRN